MSNKNLINLDEAQNNLIKQTSNIVKLDWSELVVPYLL